jgi:hypothetical protein
MEEQNSISKVPLSHIFPAVKVRIQNKLYNAQQKQKDVELASKAAMRRREARTERNAKAAECFARSGADVSISTSRF